MTFNEVLETGSYKEFCIIVADRKEFNEPLNRKHLCREC